MHGGESQVKTRKALIICAIAVLALSIGGIYSVYAETQDDEGTMDLEGCGFFTGMGWGTPFGRMMGTLSEEQRNELASEIHDLVSSKFDEWGIEPPEPLLSEEQRSELHAGIEDLREADATPEEIREYIAGQLEEWGVELPEMPGNACRFKRRGRFMNGPSQGIWKRRYNEDMG
jgi:hypothetical protein